MDYADFSDAEFREALTRVLREHSEDPSEACGEFLGFCEPILQSHGSLYQTLTRIPRPFRELMAVYQAWGMVGSDGDYRIFYDVSEASLSVEILHIWHGARQEPSI